MRSTSPFGWRTGSKVWQGALRLTRRAPMIGCDVRHGHRGVGRRPRHRPPGLRPWPPARDDGESREGDAGVPEGAARTARDREGARERRSVENQPRSQTERLFESRPGSPCPRLCGDHALIHLLAELGAHPLPPLVLQAGHIGEVVAADEQVSRADGFPEADDGMVAVRRRRSSRRARPSQRKWRHRRRSDPVWRRRIVLQIVHSPP